METQYGEKYTIERTGVDCLSLTEAKLYLKQDFNADDAVIQLMLDSITPKAEKVSGLQLNTLETITHECDIFAQGNRGFILNLLWSNSKVVQFKVMPPVLDPTEFGKIRGIDYNGDEHILTLNEDFRVNMGELELIGRDYTGWTIIAVYDIEADVVEYKLPLAKALATGYMNREITTEQALLDAFGEYITQRQWL